MIAQKFVAFKVRVVEGIFTEENSSIFTGGGDATEGHHQRCPQPFVVYTF